MFLGLAISSVPPLEYCTVSFSSSSELSLSVIVMVFYFGVSQKSHAVHSWGFLEVIGLRICVARLNV